MILYINTIVVVPPISGPISLGERGNIFIGELPALILYVEP